MTLPRQRLLRPWPRIVRTARCSAACISRHGRSAIPAVGWLSAATRSFRSTKAGLRQGLVGGRDARPSRSPDARRSSATRAASWSRRRGTSRCRRSPSESATCSGDHGPDAVARLRRRLADEREGVPARQVRARRARAPRTSTTTAASACRRRPPPQSMAFGLDRGLPFPLADIAAGRRHPARRQQRRRDDAADHAVLRGAAVGTADKLIVVPIRAGRRPRSGPTRHLPLRPGIRRGARQRPAARARARQPDRRGLHQRPHRRTSTRRAGLGRCVLAGARRAHHRRAGSGSDRDRAAARDGRAAR